MEKKAGDQKIKTERLVWFTRKCAPLYNSVTLGKITADEYIEGLKAILVELAEWDKKHGYR